ncbi:MAG: TIR domain-containing protein [Anaerolineae bacterium]|nr:TIR domain-containing protein [Anaerolineae bacterium]
MDTPIAVILIVFTIIVLVTAFLYRRQFGEQEEAEETTDWLGGPPPAKREEAEERRQDIPAPQPQPLPGETPPPSASQPPSAPAKPWDSEPKEEDEPPAPLPTRGATQEPPEPPKLDESVALVPESVKFSAYYPRETAPQVWQPLVGYVFRQSAAADVMKDVKDVLGARLQDFRRADETARQTITEGAMVTATPNLPGFQVNPPAQVLGFYEQFHRFSFKVRATSATLDQAVNGTLTFTVEGVIVAELPISIFVGEMVGETMTGAVTKSAYDSIFCSYSHKDTQIVERVERAYKALGFTYLRDVISLRSGQEWNAELMRMIEQADIFQLFWSSSSAASPYVEQEWRHALEAKRQIRPVYWEQPMAKVPDDLRSLHFAYAPDLAESE